MKIDQLRVLCEVVDQGFSMSRAAAILDMSQPHVSKQIHALEEALAVDLLLRRGGRIIGMTEPGTEVLRIARRIVRDAASLKSIGADFRSGDQGRLAIATTHFIARYLLADFIEPFHRRFPKVRITLHETTQRHALDMLQSTEADIGVLIEPPKGGIGVVQLMSQRKIGMSFVARRGHQLLGRKPMSLEAISRYPMVWLDPSLSGGFKVKRAFEMARLEPDVVMTAGNIEVVKAYVARGLGVAILPSLCVEERGDPDLAALDASHLIEPMPYFIALHPESFVRNYVYNFIESMAPEWTRRRVGQRIRQTAGRDPSA